MSILNKMIWDIILRRYGIDRRHIGPGGELRIMAAPPEMPDRTAGYGDYHVRVSLEKNFFERLREQGLLPEGVTSSVMETALAWVLGAPYTYAYELGLRERPWITPKPKKEQAQKLKRRR